MNVTVPRVIATDLDGTLLRSDATLSGRTRDALRAARAAGIRVVLATARPVRVIDEIFSGIGTGDLLDAAICGNGAVRYDLTTRHAVLTSPLLPELAASVMTEVERLLPGTFFAAETGYRVLHEHGYHYRPTLDTQRYPVRSRVELAAEPVVKLMALLPEGDAAAAWSILRPTLGELVACTWSAGRGGADQSYPAILEIAAPGVSKAVALAQLCRQWNVIPSEVAAFGDAPNDLEMLVWAGTGYAMANAHADVLAAVPHRVKSNDEDGVACFLESLLAPTMAAPPRSP